MDMRWTVIAAFMVMCLFLSPAWGQTPAAGYILTEHHFIWGDQIWGIGKTLDQAKEDARRQGANLDHDGEEMDDWIETLSVRRATADLMEAARKDRWTRFKRLYGGVWGTPAEYEARPSTGAHTSSRAVHPRDLMTREERATFRARMQQASPEEREALWHQKLTLLEQRAAASGVRLIVPDMRADGTFHPDEMPANEPARLSGGLRAPRWLPVTGSASRPSRASSHSTRPRRPGAQYLT